ncbi:MAG: hypothetical protein AAGF49_00805 [Pseudomonadota bacterium]
MRAALAGAVLTAMVTSAAAQEVPSITVRPLDDGAASGFVGPYPDLPGVSMYSGQAYPITPEISLGQVPLTSRLKIVNENTIYQQPLPVLDGWRGTLSGGIPF